MSLKENNNDENNSEKDFDKIIDIVPDDKKDLAKELLHSFSIGRSTSFSGPLPPPSVLNDYDQTIENGAERIMKMAENQSLHRIELENFIFKEEIKQSNRGQIFGFILALIGMAIAFILAYLGHDTVAGIFGTTTIIGLVTVFVLGKRNQKDE